MTTPDILATNLLGKVSILDPAIESDRLAFERAFFDSFSRAKANQLIRDLWIWDDENRLLQTRVPYEDQRIFVIRDDQGVVKTGMSFNLGQQHYQASAFGFSKPAGEGASCEILSFFSTRQNRLANLYSFLVAIAQYGKGVEMRWADATCTQRLLSIYMHFGAELLGSRSIGDEFRYHIRFDVYSFSQVPSLLRPNN